MIMASNLSFWLYLCAALILCAALLWWLLAERREALLNALLPLTLVTSHGVLLSGGVIEMAGRYGFSAVIGLFGFTLLFALAPILLLPIRRLQRVVRFANAVDFLTFRYRGRAVSLIASAGLIVASLPLLQAQFISAGRLISELLGPLSALADSILVLLTAITCWLLLPRRRRNTRLGAMALSGLLVLLSTLAIAVTVALPEFGGLGELNSWVETSGQQQAVHRTGDAYPLFVLFLAASLVLPANFLVALSDRIQPAQVRQIAWSYPLLVLLISLASLPLMWSGLSSRLDVPLQEYLYALPMAAENTALTALSSLAIISTAMFCCASLSAILARMLLNSAVLPRINFSQIHNLNGWISRRIVNIAIAIALLALLLAKLSASASITDHYLVSFVGLAQFVPGLIAASYFPNIGRKGFLTGLLLGLAVWAVGLLAPLAVGDINLMKFANGGVLTATLGDWQLWALLASVANLTGCMIATTVSRRSREERFFANLCMVDNVYIPSRVDMGFATVEEMQLALRDALGPIAEEEMHFALTQLGLTYEEQRPAKLRAIRDKLSRELSLRLGHYAASRLMDNALPITDSRFKSESDGRDDLNLIESVLAVSSSELSGVASELNRLRLHHLELVEALPVGVISLDARGEILLWNRQIAELTGLDREEVIGSRYEELPKPWQRLIQSLLDSKPLTITAHPLDSSDSPRWFNLQKSGTALHSDEDIDEQLIVIEEVTESVRLTQQTIDRDRLASIGRFAAGVAHEIGNPVTNISLLTQDLRSELPCPEVEQTSAQLLQQTGRITDIVQSLIRFTRGDSGGEQLVTLGLAELIDEAIRLSPLDDSGSRRAVNNPVARDVNVCADRHQLLQVFINLLRNADQASPPSTPIDIQWQLSTSSIQIDIIDEGSGVPEKLLQRIYEPFVTSKSPDQGTGLGLWVVYQLVGNMNGEITLFNNELAPGATARITLPRSATLAKGA